MSTAFRVILEGTQEVPPNASTASGIGTVVFDSTATAASYSFDFEGLDFGPITSGQTPTDPNDVTNAHFHNQARGVSGPVVFGLISPAQDSDDLAIVLNADGSWSVSGRWETTDPAPINPFAGVLDSATVGSDVPLYFNVHTVQFGGGAVRGQLVAIADDIDNVETGTTGSNLLNGLGGNDAILGLAGNDTLNGGNGNDVLDGGGGNDRLSGGNGRDSLEGSTGNDILSGAGDVDSLSGGAGADMLNGGTGADTMAGGAGNDTYIVDIASDILTELAGGGIDTERASVTDTLANNVENLTLTGAGNINGTGNGLANILMGNSGSNGLNGNAGADTLNGGTGNDRLDGGDGNDRLAGGAGADRLTGGLNADTFLFQSLGDSTVAGTGRDTIVDFLHAQADKIDLRMIDASTQAAGNQAFTFIGNAAFSHHAGELRFAVGATTTIVSGDVNGDGTADFAINLQGNVALQQSDFVL